VLVHEELAWGDPAAAIALWAPHMVVPALLALGDDDQKRKWLGRFAEASPGAHMRTGAVAYAERGGPLEGFATTATPAGTGYLLNGKKAFVVNGGTADVTIVFAQLGQTTGWNDVGAFVVEGGNPGLKAGERHVLVGLDAVDARELSLENCQVPEANRLRGGTDFLAAAARMFAHAGLLNAARQVGLARASYEFSLNYAQERKAFGKPIAHFQAIAFMLADMLMDVDSARWMVWRAAAGFDKGDLVAAHQAIAQANSAAWRVADNGVQILGGAGYIRDCPSEKWLRETKALALFGVVSECADLSVAAAELGHSLGAGLPSSALQPFFT